MRLPLNSLDAGIKTLEAKRMIPTGNHIPNTPDLVGRQNMFENSNDIDVADTSETSEKPEVVELSKSTLKNKRIIPTGNQILNTPDLLAKQRTLEHSKDFGVVKTHEPSGKYELPTEIADIALPTTDYLEERDDMGELCQKTNPIGKDKMDKNGELNRTSKCNDRAGLKQIQGIEGVLKEKEANQVSPEHVQPPLESKDGTDLIVAKVDKPTIAGKMPKKVEMVDELNRAGVLARQK